MLVLWKLLASMALLSKIVVATAIKRDTAALLPGQGSTVKRAPFTLNVADPIRQGQLNQGQQDAITVLGVVLGPNGIPNPYHLAKFQSYLADSGPETVNYVLTLLWTIFGNPTDDDGTGSPALSRFQVTDDDFFMPQDDEIEGGDGETPLCSIPDRFNHGTIAYTDATGAPDTESHFCDEAFNSPDLATICDDTCSQLVDLDHIDARRLDFLGRTVLHEMIHWAAGQVPPQITEDHAYGPWGVLQLAAENPGLTIQNADTITWLCIHIFVEVRANRAFNYAQSDEDDGFVSQNTGVLTGEDDEMRYSSGSSLSSLGTTPSP